MKFDNQGLPRDNGATDFMDSARLAGLMVLFDYPDFDPQLLAKYFVDCNGTQMATRHPVEFPSNNPFNFTRDQMVVLAAGLHKAGRQDLAKHLLDYAEKNHRAPNVDKDAPNTPKKWPDGPDYLAPDVMRHLHLCAGEKPDFILDISGKAFLLLGIFYASIFQPMYEPNQLLSLCMVSGPFYVRLLKKLNSKLPSAIRWYLGSWRDEKKLAELMVKKISEF